MNANIIQLMPSILELELKALMKKDKTLRKNKALAFLLTQKEEDYSRSRDKPPKTKRNLNKLSK